MEQPTSLQRMPSLHSAGMEARLRPSPGARRRSGRQGLRTLLAACVALALGCEASPPQEPDEAEGTRASAGKPPLTTIRNGVTVTPWGPFSAPTETRAIVKIGGCTGTVVDARWVLSATHCGFSRGMTVTNLRPGGNVTRTVDRVVPHPTLDVAMLSLSAPMPGDIPAISLGSGSTRDLIGRVVECYGYGAKDVTTNCTSSADCGAGQKCQSGWCLTPSSVLRTGSLPTRENTTPGYFNTVRNITNQSTLPGDSGGPCFLSGVLAGVNSAWYLDLGGAIHVSVPDVRHWVRNVIRPTTGDFNGDRRTDTAIYRPSEARWYFWESGSSALLPHTAGRSGDVPVLGDFNGDGLSDQAVWRPSTATWHVWRSTVHTSLSQEWGAPGDLPVAADYDGDGRTDLAVWRRANATWHVLHSSQNTPEFRGWGLREDTPVPADYDGDGRADLAVWRPSDGGWHIWRSSDGATSSQQWGLNGDIPAPGDFDGDGRTDPAVFRPSEGKWYIWQSSDGARYWKGWGLNGDIPVVGDYDADGRSDVAVWRPSEGRWYIWEADGASYWRGWGLSGDIPLPRLIR